MMNTNNAPPAYVAAPQPVGQQQLVTVQPALGTVGTVNPQPRDGDWTGILWTGISQMVLGSLTVILGIVTLTVFSSVERSDFASPIWCGILFYGVAGIFGIVSGFKKNSGVAIGYMVMSILACLAACCVIGFGAARIATINLDCRYPPYTSNGYDYYGNRSPHCELKAAINGVYATLILLALAEFIVAMFGASMTCGPICNSGSGTQTVIHYQARPHFVVATQPQGPAFYNIAAGQPQVAYPAQQGQYPQTQAPPPSEQQFQELIN